MELLAGGLAFAAMVGMWVVVPHFVHKKESE